MCYRCGLCQSVVPPRQPRRVHVVPRLVPRRQQVIGRSQPYGEGGYSRPIEVTHPERTEIAREIPVCGSCQSALANGVSMERLVRTRVKRVEAPAPVAAPLPRPRTKAAPPPVPPPAAAPRPNGSLADLFGD